LSGNFYKNIIKKQSMAPALVRNKHRGNICQNGLTNLICRCGSCQATHSERNNGRRDVASSEDSNIRTLTAGRGMETMIMGGITWHLILGDLRLCNSCNVERSYICVRQTDRHII
jgi:hypothetical protein